MANSNDKYSISVSGSGTVEKGEYAYVSAHLTRIDGESGSTQGNSYSLEVTDRTGDEVYSDSDTSNMSCSFSIPTSGLSLGTYTATVTCFRSDRISDYTTFTVVAPNSAPNPPSSITVPGGSIYSSTPVDISWSASTDPDGDLAGYELERQLDGSGPFNRIYRGSSRSYRDTIPAGTHTSVIYRVRAYDSEGNYSSYCTGPVRFVINNTAPTTPGSITVPDTIRGGTDVAISWAAATDADDNLDGYIVERSYNGGTSWSQIYQGRATSTTSTVPFGTTTVMFRVQAYDTAGAK